MWQRQSQIRFWAWCVAVVASMAVVPVGAVHAQEDDAEVLAPSMTFKTDGDGHFTLVPKEGEADAAADDADKTTSTEAESETPADDGSAPAGASSDDGDANAAEEEKKAEEDKQPKHWTEMESPAEVQAELDKDVRRTPRERFLMRKKLRELKRAQPKQ